MFHAMVFVGWLSGAGLVLCTSAGPTGFTRKLPSDVPDTSAWETSAGFAELDHPHRIVEYQLFVGPRRTGLYEVARYRIVVCDPEERSRSGISADEKLQWDVDGGGIRRFECRSGSPPGASPCQWAELVAGTPEFLSETGAILSVYGLHSRLLHERDAGGP
jgi:hypothetical protein